MGVFVSTFHVRPVLSDTSSYPRGYCELQKRSAESKIRLEGIHKKGQRERVCVCVCCISREC